eukprot:7379233-Prymnesium_polylepis.1
MFGKMLDMVKKCEQWNLPESRYGSVHRTIVQTHPKEVTFALRHAINAAHSSVEGGLKLEKGHFQKYPAFGELETLLRSRKAAADAAIGAEADQRRMKTLYDNEQIDLFESILREAFAGSQECATNAKRKPIDTLTLSVITAMYFSLRARGLNLDDASHGNMSITRWNSE